MRTSPALLTLPLLLFSSAPAPAQTTAPAVAAAPATASSLLAPGLATLRQSLSAIHLDKWKAPGPVRQEADSNIGSITRDLDGTLPGLLATADAVPGVISQNLPVFRNVDALYDVLLRVVETADLSAPEKDTENLHRALSSLDDARRALGDSIEGAAVQQEKQLAAMASQASVQAAAPAPSTVVDGTTKAAHKRKAAGKAPAQQPQ